MRTLLAWIAVPTLVLAASDVQADVPPPDDYVERCTLDRTCPKGKECVLCPGSYRDFSGCSSNLAEQGFAMECKSWGASVWEEIWCRDAADGDDASTLTFTVADASEQLKIEDCSSTTKPPSESESDSDCSCRTPGGQNRSGGTRGGLACATAALLLLLIRRRRES